MNNERKTPKKRSHSMSCTHPEGCCCGASEWNRLVEELEEAREENARLKDTVDYGADLATHEFDRLRQSLATAERERDEARAACVVKDEALKAAENCDHTYTQEALDLIRKALTLDCGGAILERLRKAEEENKARRFQFENKCLQWIEAKKESASLRIKVNDLQESIKGCEYRMMRAESATGGLRVAKLEAEAHCKRLSTERNAALSRCRELEEVIANLLPFLPTRDDVLDEASLNEGRTSAYHVAVANLREKALSSSPSTEKPSEPPRSLANRIMTDPENPLYAKYQSGDGETVQLVNDLLMGEPKGKMSFPEMLTAAEADPSFHEEYERLTGKRYEPSERESVAKEVARG